MPLSPLQQKHDELFKRATALLDGEIYLQDLRVPKLTWLRKRKIRKALRLLANVLEIHPQNGSAMFFAGKAHQRLGEHDTALDFLTRAHLTKPNQPDMAREASLEAMRCRRIPLALKLCQAAVAIEPDDPGLRANLALAHLLDSDPKTAKRLVDEALSIDPTDTVTVALRRLVDDVLAGRRPCPKDPVELGMLQ